MVGVARSGIGTVATAVLRSCVEKIRSVSLPGGPDTSDTRTSLADDLMTTIAEYPTWILPSVDPDAGSMRVTSGEFSFERGHRGSGRGWRVPLRRLTRRIPIGTATSGGRPYEYPD